MGGFKAFGFCLDAWANSIPYCVHQVGNALCNVTTRNVPTKIEMVKAKLQGADKGVGARLCDQARWTDVFYWA
jgi:hypothetical protein